MILAQASGDANSWWTFIGVLATTIIGAAVGIYTTRSARAANRETAGVAGQAAQLSGWQTMAKEHREEIERLRGDRDEDSKRYRDELAEMRAALVALQARVDANSRQLMASEERDRAMVTWARGVVALMRSAQLPFPPPPRRGRH